MIFIHEKEQCGMRNIVPISGLARRKLEDLRSKVTSDTYGYRRALLSSYLCCFPLTFRTNIMTSHCMDLRCVTYSLTMCRDSTISN